MRFTQALFGFCFFFFQISFLDEAGGKKKICEDTASFFFFKSCGTDAGATFSAGSAEFPHKDQTTSKVGWQLEKCHLVFIFSVFSAVAKGCSVRGKRAGHKLEE